MMEIPHHHHLTVSTDGENHTHIGFHNHSDNLGSLDPTILHKYQQFLDSGPQGECTVRYALYDVVIQFFVADLPD